MVYVQLREGHSSPWRIHSLTAAQEALNRDLGTPISQKWWDISAQWSSCLLTNGLEMKLLLFAVAL